MQVRSVNANRTTTQAYMTMHSVCKRAILEALSSQEQSPTWALTMPELICIRSDDTLQSHAESERFMYLFHNATFFITLQVELKQTNGNNDNKW